MANIHFKLLGLVFLAIPWSGHGQNLSSVVLDSVTKSPVPYVTVQLKNKGMITNEEGRFNFQLRDNIQETDSLFIFLHWL